MSLQSNGYTCREGLIRHRHEDLRLRCAVLDREWRRRGNGGVVAVAGQHADQRLVGCAALQAAQIVQRQDVGFVGRAGVVDGNGVPFAAAVVAVLNGEEQLIVRVRVIGGPGDGQRLVDHGADRWLRDGHGGAGRAGLNFIDHGVVGQQLNLGHLPGRLREEIAEEGRCAVGNMVVHGG